MKRISGLTFSEFAKVQLVRSHFLNLILQAELSLPGLGILPRYRAELVNGY